MGLFDRFKNQNQGQEFFVVAGLGNPGRQYADTKHNVGFQVIDKLAEKYGISVEKEKQKALIGDGMIQDRRVLLVKPQTFMNLSGESIREIVNFYKIPQENFVVIYDDTSMPAGQIRLREKGSHGGHNGIRNIIQQMGTDVFNRVKVGIGEKPNGWDLADYVLAKFPEEDLPLMEEGMDQAVKAVELILSRGMADAMNRMNRRPKKEKKKTEEKEETVPSLHKEETEV